MSILVIAEHDNSSIKGATLNTVAAASNINGEVSLLVAGCDTSGVIDEAKKITKEIANTHKLSDDTLVKSR